MRSSRERNPAGVSHKLSALTRISPVLIPVHRKSLSQFLKDQVIQDIETCGKPPRNFFSLLGYIVRNTNNL